MIARVYPIKRLPRRFGFFDYTIPDGMVVARGNFVQITMRGQVGWGIVKDVVETTETPHLKPLTSVSSLFTLTDAEVRFFETIAHDLVQSVATTLFTALPLPPKRFRASQPISPSAQPLSVATRDAQHITDALRLMDAEAHAFIGSRDLKQTAAIIAKYRQKHLHETIAILAPNVRDAELLASHLHAFTPLLLSGSEAVGARWHAWSQWREGGRLLIATRLGALWPHPGLHTTILVRSEHENHKQADRNPRFDARHASFLLRKHLNQRLYTMDVAPSVARASQERPHILLPVASQATIVAMNAERPASIHPLLSVSLIEQIDRARMERRPVLCAYNRKGVSARLRCHDCDHVFLCPTCGGQWRVDESKLICHRCHTTDALPLTCPSCGGTDLLRKGFGNKAIATALQKHYPDATVAVLDKESASSWMHADILLTTRFFLENCFDPFTPHPWAVVAELDADLPLFEASHRAQEHALLNAREWQAVAEASRAQFLMQTDNAPLFERLLQTTSEWLLQEEEVRRAYRLPPFVPVATIHLAPGSDTQASLLSVSARLRAEIPSLTLVEEPDRLRVSIPPSDLEKTLTLFSSLDDQYIIDTTAET